MLMIVKKIQCWWFGCKPDYSQYSVCEDLDIEPDCERCGANYVSYSEQIMYYTRHERLVKFFNYWFYRKWWPQDCRFCGSKFGKCNDDCLPF